MAVDVFISYAREDKGFLKELETHLSPLRHDGIISHWTDEQIVPGESWRNAIAERIRRAKVILLLVSPDFLASEFCYRVELNDAVAKAKARSAYVVPIVVRECDWSSAPFAFLHALPQGGRAVAGRDWPSRDAAWKSVIQGLRMTLDETQKRGALRQRQFLFALLAIGVLLALSITGVALATRASPSPNPSATLSGAPPTPIPTAAQTNEPCCSGVDCATARMACASGRRLVTANCSVQLPTPNRYNLRVAGALGAEAGDEICVRVSGNGAFGCTPFDLTADYTMPSAPAYGPGLVSTNIDQLMRRGLDIEIRSPSGAVKSSARNYMFRTGIMPSALCRGLKANLDKSNWTTFYLEDP